MSTDTLIKLFNRDLSKLKDEINLYSAENNLWKVNGEITNSAGNLCLHLVGNLNHFIGAALGNTSYIRQRYQEFSLKDVPRIELIKQIDDTIVIVESTLTKLTQQDLEQEYKHRVFEKPTTTAYFLMHLAMHLAYHLGQVNYHRRLLDN